MKKIIFLLLITFSFIGANAQSITNISPSGETITFPDNSRVRVWVKAIMSLPGAYAVAFYVDPDGKQKVLSGKNKNKGAAITFWGQPVIENGELIGYEYEVPVILDRILEGEHTLLVEVYSTGFKVVDSQETTFTIDYINP